MAIDRAEELAQTDGRLFRQQAVFGVFALIALTSVTFPNYRSLGRWSYGLLAVSVVLLITVYFFPAIKGVSAYIVMLVVLFVRPEGLIVQTYRKKV